MALTPRYDQYTPVRTMLGCNGIRALNHYDVSPGKKVSYSGTAVSDFSGEGEERCPEEDGEVVWKRVRYNLVGEAVPT
jgi:hypothetical protein